MELPSNCEVYLIATPEFSAALSSRLPLVHYAYRIGNGPHLFRTDLRYPAKGGILAADIGDFNGTGNSDGFVAEVERECGAHGFRGAFFDLDGESIVCLQKAFESLANSFRRRNQVLYVTEPYAFSSPAVQIVISTAISGGTLRQRLEDAMQRYGKDHVTLGVEWSAMDFTLPATSAAGKALSPAELSHLRVQCGRSTYFSDELCAHYFTYMNTGQDAHFVLFDDAASVTRKLRIAASLGITTAFLPIPEDRTLLDTLLA